MNRRVAAAVAVVLLVLVVVVFGAWRDSTRPPGSVTCYLGYWSSNYQRPPWALADDKGPISCSFPP